MDERRMSLKAVGFDFFGTLVDASADWRGCVLSVCKHLQFCGYNIFSEDFITNYRAVTGEHRKIRNETLREINNCVWVADTLNKMGIEVEPDNTDVREAVEKYFTSWQIDLAPDTINVLEKLSRMFEISLVSNFTHSAFLQRTMRKLNIEKFFHHIIISESIGWRKPHPYIFKHFLKLSKASAKETVFIGDDLESDIKGAKDAGIKAVLLTKNNNKLHKIVNIIPDYTVSSLTDFMNMLIRGKI